MRFLPTAACAIVMSACATVVPNVRPSDDIALQVRVQRIGKRLASIAERHHPTDDVRWFFGAVEGDLVGAGALPDGTIGVNAVFARMLKDDELAAVLAHEVAHVVLGHHAERGTCAVGGCVVLTGGAIASVALLPLWGACLGVVGLETARELGTTAYFRSHEYAADAHALWLLAAAGHRTDAAVRALQKGRTYLQRHLIPSPTVLDDHPSIDDRIATIEAVRRERGYR